MSRFQNRNRLFSFNHIKMETQTKHTLKKRRQSRHEAK